MFCFVTVKIVLAALITLSLLFLSSFLFLVLCLSRCALTVKGCRVPKRRGMVVQFCSAMDSSGVEKEYGEPVENPKQKTASREDL